MATTKLMVIRHAEKPSEDGSVLGISESGGQNPEELTAKGWQRAGALVRLFAPLEGRFSDPRIATPDVLFASAVAPQSKSLRPWHTILPLSRLLNKTIDLRHPKGDEIALVTAAIAAEGVVLIAWEHKAILGIANQIVGNTTTCPQEWPGERFDMVWIFDRSPGLDQWSFSQVPQMLLSGDQSDLFLQ